MEMPADVLVHNPTLGLKGSRATLVRISPDGFYEVNLTFGDRQHRTLLPVQATVVIMREPELVDLSVQLEIER